MYLLKILCYPSYFKYLINFIILVSKRRRLILIALASLSFIVFFNLGAYSNVSKEDAEVISNQFKDMVKDIDALGIFANNLRIALAMFIPALGVAIGLFSAYSTGLVFRALVETTPALANIPPILVLATPFGVLEVISYGIAMSQSALLIHSIVIKKGLRVMLIPTLILIGIVSALLLAGAYIEYYMIKMVEQRASMI
jgi:hypothetical protein